MSSATPLASPPRVELLCHNCGTSFALCPVFNLSPGLDDFELCKDGTLRPACGRCVGTALASTAEAGDADAARREFAGRFRQWQVTLDVAPRGRATAVPPPDDENPRLARHIARARDRAYGERERIAPVLPPSDHRPPVVRRLVLD